MTPLAEITALLRDVTGGADTPVISADTRLDGDLRLDSIELMALSTALRERHGADVDLFGFVAGLELDQIIDLTVGDVAAYVAGHR